MDSFKEVLCVKGNGIAEQGRIYYYKKSDDMRLNWQTWQYEKNGRTVYHIYAAENTDAWLFNLHDEKRFREIFKES